MRVVVAQLMPILINTDRALRPIQKLPFCYYCGLRLDLGDRVDRDHVPPKKLFLEADRKHRPLILPTHVLCNNGQCEHDKAAGQLVKILHGIPIDPADQAFRATMFRAPDGTPVVGGIPDEDLKLEEICWRWVRGCHTALYEQWLPDDALGSLLPPLPAGRPLPHGMSYEVPSEIQSETAWQIACNIRNGSVDEIRAFNDKFRYVCSWLTLSDASDFCVFALRVYDWERLGHNLGLPPRSCLGWYAAPRPRIGQAGHEGVVGTNFGRREPLKVSLDPFP